jgi:hypothetical protein
MADNVDRFFSRVTMYVKRWAYVVGSSSTAGNAVRDLARAPREVR